LLKLTGSGLSDAVSFNCGNRHYTLEGTTVKAILESFSKPFLAMALRFNEKAL